MNIEQTHWTKATGWAPEPPGRLGRAANLVLFFGSTALLKERQLLDALKTAYPNARFMGCSTAGEICSTRVLDDSLVVTAIHFASTTIAGAHVTVADNQDSFQAGKSLATILPPEGLVHPHTIKIGKGDLMAWSNDKQHRLKAKRVPPKRKIKMEQWGLGLSAKDRPTVPIEEIRRQGLALAGRMLGQGARSQPMGQNRSTADQALLTPRPSRRGATR